MSTVFTVYPSTDRIPTFEELLRLADQNLNSFLARYQISQHVQMTVGMRDDKNQILPVALTDPAWWPGDHYAWFTVPGVAGGTDAYACTLDGLEQNILAEDVATRRDGKFADVAKAALKVGRYWYFRRSAGQPAIINIAYGQLAAALAELTGGVIDSGDGAWDYRLMPADHVEFLSWYFRPEVADDPEKKEWAERCIGRVPEELASEQQVAPWWRRLLRRP